MKITAQQQDPLAAFRRARHDLLAYVLSGLILVIGVLAMPKNLAWDVLRLLMAVLFLSGLATLVWAAGDPLTRYLRARVDLQTADAGGEIRASGHALVDVIGRYGRIYVSAALAAVVFISLRVLAAWPIGSGLAPFTGLFKLGAWISLAAIPANLVFSAGTLGEILLLTRAHRRQMALSGFRMPNEQEAQAREARLAGPAVVVTGPRSFQAGTIDWSWSDFQKNAIVFGQTGSGKTVTILNALLDGLLSSANGPSPTERAAALILDPKGDYRQKIEALCTRLGRRDDLLILDPSNPQHSVRFNPLDNDDDALELSGRFGGLLQLMGMKNTQDTFWIESAKQFIQHAIALLRATEPPERPASLVGVHALATDVAALHARLFVLHAKPLVVALGGPRRGNEAVARLLDLLVDGNLKEALNQLSPADLALGPSVRYLREWLAAADRHGPPDRESVKAEIRSLAPALATSSVADLFAGSDAALAASYLGRDWMNLPDRTRGSVQGQLTAMLNPFLGEPYRTMFSGRSTMRVADVLDAGKILYIAMPRDDRSEMSRVVNTLVKLEYYRQVLLRRGKSRPSLFFCDEFQAFFSSDDGRGDAPFFARSRESFHANVVATQNLPGLLPDQQKEETIRNFLGNCAIKLFLRNTDGKTNEYASKDVFGEYDALMVNPSRQVGGGKGLGAHSENVSASEALQRMARIRPERFTQLTVPDESAGIAYAEALVHLGSRGAIEMHRLPFRVHPLQN